MASDRNDNSVLTSRVRVMIRPTLGMRPDQRDIID